MKTIAAPCCAVVIGASGGIGRALAREIAAPGWFSAVHGLSRRGVAVGPGVTPGCIDVTDEASIEASAGAISAAAPVGVVIVATGLLHDATLGPEKSWRQLDRDALMRSYLLNAVGPALVAKHFLPMLPRAGKSVFAALSARVGSIEDNRLGGWYGYRAAKAGLNQLLRTLAIELTRTRPEAICLGLHPGTVETGLSAPFRANVGEGRLFTPERAANHLCEVIERATVSQSGQVLAWDGTRIPA